jgi:hypothetical protein
MFFLTVLILFIICYVLKYTDESDISEDTVESPNQDAYLKTDGRITVFRSNSSDYNINCIRERITALEKRYGITSDKSSHINDDDNNITSDEKDDLDGLSERLTTLEKKVNLVKWASVYLDESETTTTTTTPGQTIEIAFFSTGHEVPPRMDASIHIHEK